MRAVGFFLALVAGCSGGAEPMAAAPGAERSRPAGDEDRQLTEAELAAIVPDKCHTEGNVTFCRLAEPGGRAWVSVSVGERSTFYPLRRLAAGTKLYYWGYSTQLANWSRAGKIAQEEISGRLEQSEFELRGGLYASLDRWDCIAHGSARMTFELAEDIETLGVFRTQEGAESDVFYRELMAPFSSDDQVDGTTLRAVISAAQLGQLTRELGLAGIEELSAPGGARDPALEVHHVIFHAADALSKFHLSSLDELLADMAVTDDGALKNRAQPTVFVQLRFVGRLAATYLRDEASVPRPWARMSAATMHRLLAESLGGRAIWAWMLDSLESECEGRGADAAALRAKVPIDDHDPAGLRAADGGVLDWNMTCEAMLDIEWSYPAGAGEALFAHIFGRLCPGISIPSRPQMAL